jgi:hypothetical protein
MQVYPVREGTGFFYFIRQLLAIASKTVAELPLQIYFCASRVFTKNSGCISIHVFMNFY